MAFSAAYPLPLPEGSCKVMLHKEHTSQSTLPGFHFVKGTQPVIGIEQEAVTSHMPAAISSDSFEPATLMCTENVIQVHLNDRPKDLHVVYTRCYRTHAKDYYLPTSKHLTYILIHGIGQPTASGKTLSDIIAQCASNAHLSGTPCQIFVTDMFGLGRSLTKADKSFWKMENAATLLAHVLVHLKLLVLNSRRHLCAPSLESYVSIGTTSFGSALAQNMDLFTKPDTYYMRYTMTPNLNGLEVAKEAPSKNKVEDGTKRIAASKIGGAVVSAYANISSSEQAVKSILEGQAVADPSKYWGIKPSKSTSLLMLEAFKTHVLIQVQVEHCVSVTRHSLHLFMGGADDFIGIKHMKEAEKAFLSAAARLKRHITIDEVGEVQHRWYAWPAQPEVIATTCARLGPHSLNFGIPVVQHTIEWKTWRQLKAHIDASLLRKLQAESKERDKDLKTAGLAKRLRGLS